MTTKVSVPLDLIISLVVFWECFVGDGVLDVPPNHGNPM